ncbi:MAG TPA: FIST N-terminal domain-containing protein [Chloroflexia bacterium]|nr:FIST N-terminal domain-containing protein [Chloroflexia bacterium]
MLHSAIAYSSLTDSTVASQELAQSLLDKLNHSHPDVLIVFASAQHNYSSLLEGLAVSCRPRLLLGCSSAGEFTSELNGQGSICAVALQAPESEFSFNVVMGRGLRQDREGTARQMVAGFKGMNNWHYRYRTGLVLTDALAGYTDDLVEKLTSLTGGIYQFFGGGAGDDGHFERTHVFFGTEVIADAAIMLEILSNKPVGIGVCHGWQPSGRELRVTEADGMQLVSLNATSAIEVFEDHARSTGQSFEAEAPLPFFLHNVIGLKSSDGYKLRVPLAAAADGSITCASDVPVNASAAIMQSNTTSAMEAAATATRAALARLEGNKPALAFFFDCVATRLRLGQAFHQELATLQNELGEKTEFVGFNTYGQIARAPGQFNGFHNCTAVVCILPE